MSLAAYAIGTNEFAEWHVAWLAEWHNYEECNKCRMSQINKLSSKLRPFLAPINSQAAPFLMLRARLTLDYCDNQKARKDSLISYFRLAFFFTATEILFAFSFLLFRIFSRSNPHTHLSREVWGDAKRPKGDREQFASLDLWVTDWLGAFI